MLRAIVVQTMANLLTKLKMAAEHTDRGHPAPPAFSSEEIERRSFLILRLFKSDMTVYGHGLIHIALPYRAAEDR